MRIVINYHLLFLLVKFKKRGGGLINFLPLKKGGGGGGGGLGGGGLGGGGVFEKGCFIEDLWYKLKCMEWTSLEA